MQINTVYKIFTVLGTLCVFSNIYKVQAQTGSGSSLLSTNMYVESGMTVNNFEETIYIGPGTHTIDGTWNVHAKNIWIHPTAVLTGSGKIVILNPDDNEVYSGMTGGTTIDHNNGVPIAVLIEHSNANNIILGDIADPGYGTTNPSGSLSAALKINNNFDFMVDGADVMLNGKDLIMAPNGIMRNYGPLRKVVTANSNVGHLVKESTTATAFVFPIGIAENDYAPVTISGIGTYYTSVTDYTAGPAATSHVGVNRTWHLYGATALALSLQHNTATNGAGYVDAEGYITQYLGNATWSTSVLHDYTSAGVHSNNVLAASLPALGTADGAFFSKTSDDINALPVTLQGFDALKVGQQSQLLWVTASEQNALGFDVERSVDGRSWEKLGFVASQSENGTSQHQLAYRFWDVQPHSGENLYRLKLKDLDGKYEYSVIRKLYFDGANSITVFPNPAVRTIQVKGLSGNESIVVYDVLGNKVLASKADGNTAQTIAIESLASGTYFIKIIKEDAVVHTQKIQVLR